MNAKLHVHVEKPRLSFREHEHLTPVRRRKGEGFFYRMEGGKAVVNEGDTVLEKRWALTIDMLKSGCNLSEVCANLGISANTLKEGVKRIFGVSPSDFLRFHRSSGDAMLRAAQFKVAVLKENPDMLKFLGKQRLGQSDKEQGPEVTVNVAQTLVITAAERSKTYADIDEALDNAITPQIIEN